MKKELSEISFWIEANRDVHTAKWESEIWPIIEAKINRLIVEARLEELKRLKGIDAFNEAYSTDPRPSRLISIRIEELSNNLSKGDGK